MSETACAGPCYLQDHPTKGLIMSNRKTAETRRPTDRKRSRAAKQQTADRRAIRAAKYGATR